jgi:primosomal protein N' (replication factor Y)
MIECAQSTEVPATQLKRVLQVLRSGPGLDAVDLELLHFASDYYHHPLGQVVLGALPARLRTVSAEKQRRATGLLRLTTSGAALDLAALPARAILKRRLLESLKAEPLSLSEVRARFPRAARAIRELTADGWIVVSGTEAEKPVPAAPAIIAAAAPTLTPEQAAAVATHLRELPGVSTPSSPGAWPVVARRRSISTRYPPSSRRAGRR